MTASKVSQAPYLIEDAQADCARRIDVRVKEIGVELALQQAQAVRGQQAQAKVTS